MRKEEIGYMNSNAIRIKCPDSSQTREERIKGLFAGIEEWCRSDELLILFEAFDVNADFRNLPLKDLIELENREASKLWDFRKKTVNGKRADVIDTEEILEKEPLIMETAKRLGLTDITEPRWKPDYILPLGGARLTNLVRPYMARFLVDQNDWSDLSVVALSAYRDKWSVDEPFYNEYAPEAETEFEAMCAGLEVSFDLSQDYIEEGDKRDHLYTSSSIRKYNDKYKGCNITALAAPYKDNSRWANSKETYEFFLSLYNIEPGEKLLLVTSEIYVPTQSLAFMDLAIEQQLEIDCVGVDPVAYDTALSKYPNLKEETSPGGAFSKVSNYLQEIKSTTDRIYTLSQKYLHLATI